MKKKIDINLDIGCGPNKKFNYIGIDMYKYPGVEHVLDLNTSKIPYSESSIKSIYCSHFLEHVVDPTKMLDEFGRVLSENSSALIIVPHYSNPYSQHFTHITYWSSFSFNQEYLDYYCRTSFVLESVKIRFATYGPLNNFFGYIFNKHKSLYEWIFSPLIKAWEIHFTIKKLSTHEKNNDLQLH